MATFLPHLYYYRPPSFSFDIQDITRQLEARNGQYHRRSSEKPELFVKFVLRSHYITTVVAEDHRTELPVSEDRKFWEIDCKLDMDKLRKHHDSSGMLHGMLAQCEMHGGPGGDPATKQIMVERIIEKGLEIADKNRNTGRKLLGLCVNIGIQHVSTYCAGCVQAMLMMNVGMEEQMLMEMMMEMLMERMMEMSMEDDPNKGMVPASESAIGKVLKKISLDLEEGDQSCIVCMDDLKGGSEAVVSMPCEHVFHDECIVNWLRHSHYCPICRFEVPID